MPNLYIISGCNGAGKTTLSYTLVPEILHCREFVNADNIAAGLSPFNTDGVAMEAGRIMLKRVDDLINDQVDFALETTLSTRSYVSLIRKAHLQGYKVSLLYLWLSSTAIAVQRVARRVSKGGHHIPDDVIQRRYDRGLHNLYHLYMPVCDEWAVIKNIDLNPELIAKYDHQGKGIFSIELWNLVTKEDAGEIALAKMEKDTFASQVMGALKIALDKLAHATASNDESLVIGDMSGIAAWIPAKELVGISRSDSPGDIKPEF